MIETLSINGKYGTDISAELKDAKERGGAVLYLNFAADDSRAKINEYLAKEHGEELAAAAKTVAEELGAVKTVVVAPEGFGLTIEGAEVVTVKNSPVLREESALIHITETGELRSCPMEKDFPSEGLHGETAAILDGETLYRIGAGCKESKVIVLKNKDTEKILEVPLGKKVSEVIAENGMEAKKPILLGGITGKFIPVSGETEVSYDALFDLIRVFGDSECMAHETAELMKDAHEESCTKCVICREGSWHFSAIYGDIVAGKGKKDDLDMIADIGPLVHIGSFCSFGKNMANAATTSAELNRDELLAHITKKQCPAGVCAAFNRTTYCIDPEKCVGCGDCEDECPEMAIEGKAKFIYMIDQDMCTGCGDCVSSCDEDAIIVNDGKIKLPKKLTKVGKF